MDQRLHWATAGRSGWALFALPCFPGNWFAYVGRGGEEGGRIGLKAAEQERARLRVSVCWGEWRRKKRSSAAPRLGRGGGGAISGKDRELIMWGGNWGERARAGGRGKPQPPLAHRFSSPALLNPPANVPALAVVLKGQRQLAWPARLRGSSRGRPRLASPRLHPSQGSIYGRLQCALQARRTLSGCALADSMRPGGAAWPAGRTRTRAGRVGKPGGPAQLPPGGSGGMGSGRG